VKILVLKRDKIGDLLLSTPMLAHLKASRPEAQVHLLANDYNAWVAEGNTNIDRLWVYPRFRHGGVLRWSALVAQLRQLIQLRRERFDFAIAAGGIVSPRAVKRLLLLGARRTIAYADQSAPFRKLTDPQRLTPGTHEVEANLKLLAPLGISAPAEPRYPSYALPRQWIDFGRAWLSERGIAPGGCIVIGLNARRAKRKPSYEQILSWAAHAKRAWALDTVLIWQPGAWDNRLYPGDDQAIVPLLEKLPKYIFPFRDERGVQPALGIVWNARAAVFPDGGIAHLASVSPAGVLALFAETDVSPHPDNWRPYSRRGYYLEAANAVAQLSDERVLALMGRLVESYPDPAPG
jgi:ADP-heptose:LPS heptosyltransferase